MLVLFIIASQGFSAYQSYPALDIPTHFAGGAVIAFFIRRATANAESIVGEMPLSIHWTLTLWGTALAALLWELYEYLSDHFLGTHMVYGLGDTLLDLLMDMLGAATVLVLRDGLGVRFHAPREPHTFPKEA
ncbi:MAG: hypothetical protein EXR39_05855 [Betaproteobacteria bacterium]|nr:hypothetical protein [Betaproteobacteria bacterium]